MQKPSLAKWILLIGLAFVFLYFGIDKFAHPIIWIGWMPGWMDGLMGMSNDTWMNITAVAEIIMGILVLVPNRKSQKLGVALMFLHLIAVLTQVGWNDVAVRDIGLLLMSAAAWFLI